MSNLDRLKSAYAAWNKTKGASRDVWAALMAERFHLQHVDETSPGLGFAKDSLSRDEALGYLTAIFADWEMEHYTPEVWVGDGDTIAMFGKSAFRHKGTGKSAKMRMGVLWQFKGDQAISLTEVFDTAVAVRAATP
jgi:ketosteroid isomerase-like protein